MSFPYLCQKLEIELVKRKKNKMRNKFFLMSFVLIITIACNNVDKIDGVFISTKNENDTLEINSDSTYIRKLKNSDSFYVDKGSWFYDQNRLWFDSWVNRGETYSGFNNQKGSVSFSFNKNISGYVDKIYFDVDNYYYYKRSR